MCEKEFQEEIQEKTPDISPVNMVEATSSPSEEEPQKESRKKFGRKKRKGEKEPHYINCPLWLAALIAFGLAAVLIILPILTLPKVLTRLKEKQSESCYPIEYYIASEKNAEIEL